MTVGVGTSATMTVGVVGGLILLSLAAVCSVAFPPVIILYALVGFVAGLGGYAVGYLARKYGDGALDERIKLAAVKGASKTGNAVILWLKDFLTAKVFVTASTVYVTKYAEIVEEKAAALLRPNEDFTEKAATRLITKFQRALHSPVLDSGRKKEVAQLVDNLQKGMVSQMVYRLDETLVALNDAEAEQIPLALESVRFGQIKHKMKKQKITAALEASVKVQYQELSRFMR